MQKMVLVPLFLAFVTACSFGSADAKQMPECAIKSPAGQAIAGGFTAPIRGNVHWTSAGALHINGRILCPYLYSRVWGESGRGTSRLVFFSGDYTYLGSYPLTAPRKIRASGSVLYITTMMDDIDRLDFKSTMLPKQIYIDGELVSLFK